MEKIKDMLTILKSKKMFVRWIMIIGIIVLGLLSIKPITTFVNNKDGLESYQYTVLKKGKCIDYIEAKGKVDTLNDSIGVYASAENQKLKLLKVNVKVGDKVNKGDILAELDSSNLEMEIEEGREKLNASKVKTSINLKSKEEAYKNIIEKNENNSSNAVIEGEKNLNAAKLDLDTKSRAYEQNKILSENGSLSNEQLIQSKEALDNAKNTYDSAVSALESIKNDNEKAIEQAENDYDSAKAANDDKSEEIALSIKEKQLNECKIQAPSSGTITSAMAKEGTPSGTTELFQIDDLDNLIVEADVKEKDISKISIGQKVDITTDATEDDILKGTVIEIEPRAKKEDDNPLELNDNSDDDAEFMVKIQFDEKDERILAGMNADVNIILDEKEDAYTVPCSCILNNNDYSIYIAKKQGDKYIVDELFVTKGTENDTETEISGQDIEDDLIVLNVPTDYYKGQVIKIKVN